MATTSLAEYTGTLASRESVKQEVYTFTESFTLALDQEKTYDANSTAVLGANYAQYELTTIGVELYVVDMEAGSVTQGYYVDASDAAHIGFKATGEVKIKAMIAGDYLIRISARKKPAN